MRKVVYFAFIMQFCTEVQYFFTKLKTMWHKFLRAAGSGNSKGGGAEWVIAPSDFFLAPSLALSVFFLISRLSSFG